MLNSIDEKRDSLLDGELSACRKRLEVRAGNTFRVVRLDEGETLEAPSVVCLGFFDGVHIGHQRLIAAAVAVARTQGLISCAHTFSEMPVKVIRPDCQVLELTPLAEKLALFRSAGLDAAAVSNFDENMRMMHARDFFVNCLLNGLKAKHLVVGYDHRFGYHGECGAEMLSALCAEYSVGLTVIEPVRLASGELVSSTAVRKAVSEGDFALAQRMLGRPCPEAMRRRNGE